MSQECVCVSHCVSTKQRYVSIFIVGSKLEVCSTCDITGIVNSFCDTSISLAVQTEQIEPDELSESNNYVNSLCS